MPRGRPLPALRRQPQQRTTMHGRACSATRRGRPVSTTTRPRSPPTTYVRPRPRQRRRRGGPTRRRRARAPSSTWPPAAWASSSPAFDPAGVFEPAEPGDGRSDRRRLPWSSSTRALPRERADRLRRRPLPLVPDRLPEPLPDADSFVPAQGFQSVGLGLGHRDRRRHPRIPARPCSPLCGDGGATTTLGELDSLDRPAPAGAWSRSSMTPRTAPRSIFPAHGPPDPDLVEFAGDRDFAAAAVRARRARRHRACARGRRGAGRRVACRARRSARARLQGRPWAVRAERLAEAFKGGA